MAYKKIKIGKYFFKIADKKSWISFSEQEIREILKSFKINDAILESIYNLVENQESKEIVETSRIPALNRIEILGYLAEIKDNFKPFKSVKDIKKLRLKFQKELAENESLRKLVKSNQDYERSSIADDFKEIETRKISENYPVFNIKLVLKYILEKNLGNSLNLEIKKSYKK